MLGDGWWVGETLEKSSGFADWALFPAERLLPTLVSATVGFGFKIPTGTISFVAEGFKM